MQTTNYSEWTVDQLKRLDIDALSEVEKFKLKNSRPTPDISIPKSVHQQV